MKKLHLYIAILLMPLGLCAQEQFSVYFDTNKYDLKQSELQRLEDWIKENKTSKILAINGYTDEDGTIKLNDTLAQNRVNRVYALVKGRVPTRDDFKTHSFGELHKQSAIKAQNRKVTLYYLQEKDLDKENQILGIKGENPAVEKPVKITRETKQVSYPDKIMVQGPQGREEIKLDTVFMQKITKAKPGEALRIDNLNFYENTFAVMPDSRPRLYELLHVMYANPLMKIKLEGHVCCMSADRRDLSTQRAKAIMMFLNQNGIEKSRLSFQGFGVSKPIYTIPEKTPEEREANRRVEVLAAKIRLI